MNEPLPGATFLRVKNGLKEKIVSRYDGVDYVWKAGESRDIPTMAAEHIFGFGQDDKSRAMNRLGWMPSSNEHDAAYEKLASIEFDMVEQVFQLPGSKKPKKLGNARSSVNAEGPEGDSDESPEDPEAEVS